jgi:DivIVA domain-containing protein
MTDPDVTGPGAAGAAARGRRPLPRLTPERVRSVDFTRTPIGRRGVSEEEVQAFLLRVAEDIAARDAAEATLRAEVAFYKDRLRDWQAARSAEGAGEADAAAATPAPSPTQPSIEAVNILSRAQQEADAYVAQAQEYCRRLTEDARDHADAILAEARQEAEAAGEQAARDYRSRSGAGYAAECEELERRLAWARTFVASLEAVETQIRTTREALAWEFDRLATPPPAGD